MKNILRCIVVILCIFSSVTTYGMGFFWESDPDDDSQNTDTSSFSSGERTQDSYVVRILGWSFSKSPLTSPLNSPRSNENLITPPVYDEDNDSDDQRARQQEAVSSIKIGVKRSCCGSLWHYLCCCCCSTKKSYEAIKH